MSGGNKGTSKLGPRPVLLLLATLLAHPMGAMLGAGDFLTGFKGTFGFPRLCRRRHRGRRRERARLSKWRSMGPAQNQMPKLTTPGQAVYPPSLPRTKSPGSSALMGFLGVGRGYGYVLYPSGRAIKI
ncbi:hypothetical protein B0H13DRAFT_1880191 [Mycena leptocephala]|nr:hypothetical protein B0H13DRAFT_1880191 [Mycena leptocephala]